MTILITGGAGFIGSAFVRESLSRGARVVCLDKLTYAGRPENLEEFLRHPRFVFEKGDVTDFDFVRQVVRRSAPTAVVNLAAETHVDHSIRGPAVFIETNIKGTLTLLEVLRSERDQLAADLRYVQVSTDEVFGELGPTGAFDESSPYNPSSPYSASKAAADHLVRAWHRTYGLSTLIANASNNYGPRQYPEKLIPSMLRQAFHGRSLTIYGSGQNVRDWIHVEDFASGLWLVLTRGRVGESYGFSGHAERTNLQVVRAICRVLDQEHPRGAGSYEDLITFVADRPGHDFRYAIDDHKARTELGFQLRHPDFEEGLRQTVRWALARPEWFSLPVLEGFD